MPKQWIVCLAAFFAISAPIPLLAEISLGDSTPSSAPQPAQVAESSPPSNVQSNWCAPELKTLPGEICVFAPERSKSPRTLVIYLHGLVKAGTVWQWTQQRSVVRNAKRMGFTALMPRGRLGISPQKWPDYWAWPTAVAAQAQVEASIIAEWRRGREILEKENGVPFERVYVLGFSNGAYYGSSLALRGQFPVDGFGIFAGGGHSFLRPAAEAAPHRAPIYVGFGMRDREAKRDSTELAAVLRAVRWPHRSVGRNGVGHAMTDSQVESAFSYFRQQNGKRE